MKRHVILTGDGEGLGNAVLHHLLRRANVDRVIGVSRRPAERVTGWSTFTSEQQSRFTHLSADLSDAAQVDEVIYGIEKVLAKEGGRIASLILVNGTGFLDPDVKSDPKLGDLMEALNIRSPKRCVEGLMAHLEPTAPVFYFSGIVTHESIRDPLLRTHAEMKRRAVRELGGMLGERLKVVMPGAYLTHMLEKNVKRIDALLEWYAVPIADPYAEGGLTDLIARLAALPAARSAPTIVRPRISRWLVNTHSAEQLERLLPGAIRRAARAVLAQTGQRDADHDARVAHFKRTRLYGDHFPYDSITSQRLWPAWLSGFYARTLRLLSLLH